MRVQMNDMVFVQNLNKFLHTDMFNGEEYVFPAGEKVAITTEAATHLFGFNLPDKSDVLRRLGWHIKSNTQGKMIDDPEGVKKLANFKFSVAELTEASPKDEKMIV